jgi:hypothetical protein
MDGYLAVGASQLLVKLLSLAESCHHGSRPTKGRCALPEFEHQEGERLLRVSEVDPGTTRSYGDVITAEQGSRLMCISGTADMLEQRGVVDVADISLVESQVAGETASE